VLGPPAGAPDGDSLVGGVDGPLRRIDLATGGTVWSVGLRTDVDTTPAVGDDVVVVIDRGGAGIARSLDDGGARWSTDLLGAERAAAGEGVIAVQASNAAVWVLDPADGTQLWRSQHSGVGRELLVADGVVVSQSDEGTVAWGVDSDGEKLWTSAATEKLLAGDGRFVLATTSGLEVREPDGEVVGEVELGEVGLGVTRVILDAPRGIRVLQSNTTGMEVRR